MGGVVIVVWEEIKKIHKKEKNGKNISYIPEKTKNNNNPSDGKFNKNEVKAYLES